MAEDQNHVDSKALNNDNSPARTKEATILANCLALSPGTVAGPLTPNNSNMEPCGSKIVPPPIVPTSMDGIDTEIFKSPSSVSSNKVIQLEDSTF
ncbi:hypothetical protein WICPIJ_006327 [Wickerhamomyces pijperi]|uniref:Uncharacterized protein n=1 Tax=Wickerhamomyces pijperi TaxID=599730 RepID=A0A9P8TL28_WICPI|nr:hypothetical protein WICPIJ_006327 [Wickerhamomyces pijperi]